jgi:hypothetical protein
MTLQLLLWPLNGATSVAPGSAVCRTVAEKGIAVLGGVGQWAAECDCCARSGRRAQERDRPRDSCGETFGLIDK